ncbi:MAG: hypothetical protein WC002_01400 [Candidatus Muiribacteriota bacterium]|jgi:hypothetical protein
MEKCLKLIHFSFENNINDSDSLINKFYQLDGIESVDIIGEEKIIYISFDCEYISIDDIIAFLKNNGVKIIT